MSSPSPARVPQLVRLSIAFAVAGIVFCLLLLIRETPYTLTAFMFLGQPLLAIAFFLYAWKVFRDLKHKELL
jgi:hypothetical protein